MRWIVVAVVCALAAPAAAAPPSEDAARAAAAAWFRAAAHGDGAALARASAFPLVVEIDAGLDCPMKRRIRSRHGVARLARRLKRCLFPMPAEKWHGDRPSGDRRTVIAATSEETFYIFDVTVDARGRVVQVTEQTAYGGDFMVLSR